MNPITLTNLLLTGILLVQCYAVIFRDRGSKNHPKFPLDVQ